MTTSEAAAARESARAASDEEELKALLSSLKKLVRRISRDQHREGFAAGKAEAFEVIRRISGPSVGHHQRVTPLAAPKTNGDGPAHKKPPAQKRHGAKAGWTKRLTPQEDFVRINNIRVKTKKMKPLTWDEFLARRAKK